MNREEIIRMARETGVEWLMHNQFYKDHLQNFAALVAAAKDKEHKEAMRWDIHSCGPTCTRYACVATRKAVAAERERIAAEWDGHMYGDLEDIDIGAAIRARGETTSRGKA